MKKTISILTVSLFLMLPAFLINSCKKDPCKDKVCQNGGTCNDGDCSCPGGYSGTNCQIHDLCYGKTCLNGGGCVDGTCICPTGYTGVNCQTAVQTDPCQGITCLNGGTCISGTCLCPDGFTGPNCGTVVNNDPCQGITCYNGGTCANGICNCPTGFTGSDCNTVIPLASVTITKIVVTNYPQTTTGGAGWDLGSGPDAFLSIAQGTSCSTTATTGTITDASGNLTYNNGFPLVLAAPNSQYSFCMFDYDYPSADDFMTGFNFIPSDYKTGYPASFSVSNAEFAITVYVTWNF